MRESSARTNIRFTGQNERFYNEKQSEWRKCLEKTSLDKGVAKFGVKRDLEVNLNYADGLIEITVDSDNIFCFQSEQDSAQFLRILFYYLNNDGENVELDYFDFSKLLASSKQVKRLITCLDDPRNLIEMEAGSLVCVVLMPGFENAISEAVKLYDWIERKVNNNVVACYTDLIVREIKSREAIFFVTSDIPQ
jgi:hypothetical protein